MADPELTAEEQPESTDFIVTAVYRQEIHARGEAVTREEAAAKAFKMFQEWLLTMRDMEGISFGPEDPSLEEQMTVTFAKNPTREDPTYWTDREEMDVWEDHEGEIQVRTYD